MTAPLVARGRITLVASGRVRLEHAVEPPRELAWPEASEALTGAWVELVLDASGSRVTEARVVQPARAAFPRAGGDWLAFHRDGRRRLRWLTQRAAMMRALRDHLAVEGLLEVETPLAVPSPGLDVHLSAFEVAGMPGPRWLITSPEYQMKRLLAAGLPGLYEIVRCFRKDERGQRHEPEFTMLEWYRAFADAGALMADTERIVAVLAMAAHGRTTITVDALGARSEALDLTPPWERITVDAALARHAGLRLDDVLPDEERFFRVWSHDVEPALGFARPVFVTDWPASMASLARLHPDRPHLADRFEAYACGIELCNGFGELTDPVEQRARLVRDQEERRALGLPVYPIDERFLGALEEGLPPCAGNALGLDRVLALLLGAPTIADVMAFGSERL